LAVTNHYSVPSELLASAAPALVTVYINAV